MLGIGKKKGLADDGVHQARVRDDEQHVEGASTPAPDADYGEPPQPEHPHELPPVNLQDRPVVRVGLYAWALVGLAAALFVLGQIVGRLSVVVVPLGLALFPAAILMPLVDRMKRVMPDAAAALISVLGLIAIVAGIFTLLGGQVVEQMDGLSSSAQEGVQRVEDFLAGGPFGLQPIRVGDLISQAREALQNVDGLTSSALGAARSVVEVLTETLFGLFALFFYLKDGPALARGVQRLLPERFRTDAREIGSRAWHTVGSYIRGQILIALIDAVLIGTGLAIVRVPLAIPLGVLVFFGGLFPIVGAFLSGSVAVLVALATSDRPLVTALIVLAIVLGVQQLEGHILAPVVLGRATELHPLVAIASLTAGGVVLGVLGAFIAIPLVASLVRAGTYVREKVPG